MILSEDFTDVALGSEEKVIQQEKVIWFVGIKERSDVILGVMACDVLPVAMFFKKISF